MSKKSLFIIAITAMMALFVFAGIALAEGPETVYSIQTGPGQEVSLQLANGQEVAVTRIVTGTGQIRATFVSPSGFNLLMGSAKQGSVLDKTDNRYKGIGVWDTGNLGGYVGVETSNSVTAVFTSDSYLEYEVVVRTIAVPVAPTPTPTPKPATLKSTGVWYTVSAGKEPVEVPFDHVLAGDNITVDPITSTVNVTVTFDSPQLFTMNDMRADRKDDGTYEFTRRHNASMIFFCDAYPGNKVRVRIVAEPEAKVRVGYFPAEPRALPVDGIAVIPGAPGPMTKTGGDAEPQPAAWPTYLPIILKGR